MLDWLSKIFSSIVSAKAASIALLACIGIVAFWDIGIQLVKSRGVQNEHVPFLLIAILYSTSHLLVMGSIRCWVFIDKYFSNRKLSINNRKNLEIFRDTVKKTIPQLPDPQIKILKQLSKSEQTIDITKNGVLYLIEQNYIKRIHRVSHISSVFEINTVVKDELSEHINNQRTKKLEEFLVNITKEEKIFLALFFSEVVTEGTCESGKKMEPNVYRAGENMVHRDILYDPVPSSHKSKYEVFGLQTDVAEILERKVFNKKPVRNEINLDPCFILATRASGLASSV